MTVKVRIVKAEGKAGGIQAHLRYLEREGVGREGRLYSTFTDEADRDAFIERGLEDRQAGSDPARDRRCRTGTGWNLDDRARPPAPGQGL